MLRITPLVATALALAACGSSTTTNEGTTPGVDPAPTTTDGEPVFDSVAPSDPETSEAIDTTVAPEVAETTAAPDTTTAPEPEPSPDTTTAPEPTTQAPTSATAVTYGGSSGEFPWAPLLWWDGSAWNQAGFTVDGTFVDPPTPGIASVALTSLDLPDGPGQVITGATLGASDFYCVGDETGPTIDFPGEIPTSALTVGYDALAVTADWPLQPRPVSQVGLDSPEYQAVGEALVSAPTSDLGTVTQVVRVDLDGNGIEEVLVTYDYITEPNFGAENDFSAVYVRIPAADGTVDDVLVEEYVLGDPTDFPTVGGYSLAAVADLNGDGVMEVGLRSRFWESAGIAVYEYTGSGLSYLGGGGCGV